MRKSAAIERAASTSERGGMTTSAEQTPRIFVSHSHKDNDFGLKLVQDLRQALGDDTSVWYDAKGGLHGGDLWWDKIKEELKSRYVFLVVLSPDALNSPWVQDEIRIAWKQKNAPGGKHILPVLHRSCEVPDDLDTLHVISFLSPKIYEDAFNELLTALGLPVGMETRGAVGKIDDPGEHVVKQRIPQITQAFVQRNWTDVLDQTTSLIRQVPSAVPSTIYRMQGLAYFVQGAIHQADEALSAALALVSDPVPRLRLLAEHVHVLLRMDRWNEVFLYTDEALGLVQSLPSDQEETTHVTTPLAVERGEHPQEAMPALSEIDTQSALDFEWWASLRQQALTHLSQEGKPSSKRESVTLSQSLSLATPAQTTSYSYRGHTHWVYSVAWSPDSTYLASASADHTAHIWEWEGTRGKQRVVYRGHTSRVNSLAWSPETMPITTTGSIHAVKNTMRVASASNDKTVQVWDAFTGHTFLSYEGHSHWVTAVAWSPDGTRIASASTDRTVQVWDAMEGILLVTYEGHSYWVNAVSWSPDGTRIASASSDRTVQIWEATTGRHLLTYHGHTKGVNTLVWSPHGLSIASASNDKTIQVWDAFTGDRGITYKDHGSPVLGLARSPHGRRIASTGERTVRVWYAATGDSIFANTQHSDWVRAVAWSPNGRYLASAGDDKTVRVRSIVDEGPPLL